MRNPARRETARTVRRLVAAALLALWGIALVPFFGVAVAAGAHVAPGKWRVAANASWFSDDPAGSERAAEAAHRQLCHCAHCPGRKQCCCQTATSTRESCALRAVCDDQTGAAAASVALVRYLPGIAGLLPPATHLLPRGGFLLWSERASSRAPHPLILPPRLS